MAAPAQPATTAPVQTVQSLPPTAPPLPDIAVDESAAPAPRAERTPVRSAARSAAVKATSAAPTAARITAAKQAAASEAPAPVAERTPAEAVPPPMAQVPPVAAPAPVAQVAQVTPAASSDGMDYAGWALIGGGLLLVAGGAAFALRRRPRRDEEAYDEIYAASEPVEVVPAAPVPLTPAMATRPAVAEPKLTVEDPVVETPRRAAPVMEQVQRRPVAAPVAIDDRRAALEAMIAEAPSEANPFHSRRNRLRRADFLLRTGQARPEEVLAPAPATAAEAAAPARDRWTEMSFGSKRASRINWKPLTSR